MTQRSGLLAVLATVLLVLSFTTHVPAPRRTIPVSGDRLVPHASARVSLGPTDPTGPISAVGTTDSERGPVATLVDAGHVEEAITLLETALRSSSHSTGLRTQSNTTSRRWRSTHREVIITSRSAAHSRGSAGGIARSVSIGSPRRALQPMSPSTTGWAGHCTRAARTNEPSKPIRPPSL